MELKISTKPSFFEKILQFLGGSFLGVLVSFIIFLIWFIIVILISVSDLNNIFYNYALLTFMTLILISSYIYCATFLYKKFRTKYIYFARSIIVGFGIGIVLSILFFLFFTGRIGTLAVY